MPANTFCLGEHDIYGLIRIDIGINQLWWLFRAGIYGVLSGGNEQP